MENKHRHCFDWCTLKQANQGHHCGNKLGGSRQRITVIDWINSDIGPKGHPNNSRKAKSKEGRKQN